MVYNALDIAKYVIEGSKKTEGCITNLKLQKLLYYIQGYTLKETREHAFDDDIVNWAYGPVIQDVYYRYCPYVSDAIDENYEDDPELLKFQKNKEFKDLRQIIDSVLRNAKDNGAFELVRMSHSEDPWKNTKQNEIISQNEIYDYFSKHNPLNLN